MGVGLIEPGAGGGGAAPVLIAAFTHQRWESSGVNSDLVSPSAGTAFDLTDCNIKQYASPDPIYEASIGTATHPFQTGYAFVAKVPNGHRIVVDLQMRQDVAITSNPIVEAVHRLDMGVEPSYAGSYLGYGLYPTGPVSAQFRLDTLFPSPGASLQARAPIFDVNEPRWVHQDFIVPDNDPAGWYAYFNPRPSSIETVVDGVLLGRVKYLQYTLWDLGAVAELA